MHYALYNPTRTATSSGHRNTVILLAFASAKDRREYANQHVIHLVRAEQAQGYLGHCKPHAAILRHADGSLMTLAEGRHAAYMRDMRDFMARFDQKVYV